MQIECCHPARLPGHHLGTAVVIDVLRATSTATILIARGATRMFAVETPGDIQGVTGGIEERFLIVSELEEIEPGPHRIDNSPTTARHIDLAGRVPILVTTNGTRALGAAVRCSDVVLIASFLNLASVAEHLKRAAPRRVTLLPAGKFADVSGRIEDDLCAEMLHRVLVGDDPDEEAVFRRIREDANVQRRLQRPGFAADLDLALTPNLCDVVPFVPRENGSIFANACLIQPL